MNLPNVIHLPSDEEAERSRRFTVHRHYLGSVELMLAALYGMGDDQPTGLLAVQRRLPAFTRIQRRAVANPAELRRLLAISWASEIQLRLADVGGDSFLRYSNAWGPVQAYYAVYMSIHAYLSTVGMGGLVDDHTSTLRTAVSQVVLRGLLPHPWDMTCAGCPELGTRVISGVPAGVNPDAHFENLAGPTFEDFYPRFAKMLDSTRTQRLERNRREWLARSGRKRMPRAEKEAAASRLHPTTVFDYLWRLRIRSNYGDVSAFLMSGVDDRSHAAFHRGLVTLASGTCLLLQSLIIAYVGPGPYETALNEFTAGGGIALAGPIGFLQQRGDLLAPSRATSR